MPWVQALLDHAAIQQNHDDPVKAPISPPPHFKFTANDRTHLPPPNGTPARASTPKARGRPRGGSPAKNASPAKSHKKRVTKKEKEADAATARQASEALQSALDDTVSTAAPESSVDGDKARVEVESVVEVKGDKETTMTNVRVEMSSKELQLSENPEEMIAKAKEMVEEVKKIEGESSSGPSKRKAEELDESDDAADNELQPAKRARLLQQALKKEKVRNRAMIGVAATLAIGYVHLRLSLARTNILIFKQRHHSVCLACIEQTMGSVSPVLARLPTVAALDHRPLGLYEISNFDSPYPPLCSCSCGLC